MSHSYVSTEHLGEVIALETFPTIAIATIAIAEVVLFWLADHSAQASEAG